MLLPLLCICYNKHMNIYRQLNLAFDYIEENLFDEINISSLSQFIGTSVNNFKNFFSLLTGISIHEYIRNRRLSECVKLLQDNKIIDVAMLCGYENRASFSRAFKAFHGLNPSEYDKKKSFNYISRINYNEVQNPGIPYQANYKIVEDTLIYGICKECQDFSSIAIFWENILKKYPIFRTFDKYYGVVYKNPTNGRLKYYVGLKEKFADDNEIIQIKSGRYISIVFSMDNVDKIEILGKSMKTKNIDKYPNIEIYRGDSVELLFKVFD